MEITWLGHASFRIRVRAGGEWVSIVTDPYEPAMVGLRFPRVTAEIVTVSHEHEDHNKVDLVLSDKSPKILRGPGEYEVKGVVIRGIASWHDSSSGSNRGENTIFVFELEGIRVVHLGDLGHKLTERQLDEIGNCDILLIPVGGLYTITPQTAAEVVSQLEPKIVIPMHYKVSGMTNSFADLSSVEEFIKIMGIQAKHQEKFEAKRETLGEELQLVVLEIKK